jgi:hypothetical protein
MTTPQILIQKAYITVGTPVDLASFAPLSVQSVASQLRGLLKPDPDRFTSELGSGIVYDPVTGLMWSQKEIDALEWEAASKACSNFKLGGYSDWYLPDRYEQLTILDLDRHGPCLPQIFETKGEAVWTSTQTAWTKGKAGSSRSFFYVYMYYGYVYNSFANFLLRSRPVRRASPASQ